jgi:DNA polymerase III subunit delta
MTYKELEAQLKKKVYKPVYMLHGEEAYFIDQLSNYFEKEILNEGERAFNLTVLYGKDSDSMAVVDSARRYPMMSPYQVVIVKEAQEMKSLTELQTYIEKPTETTILVLCHKHKKLDMRTKFAKTLAQHGEIMESTKLYDNNIPDWIEAYLKTHRLIINHDAMTLIAEYLGTDLSKVANELDKLAINLSAGTTVTVQHVDQYIGISKEYNIFELQKALAVRDVMKSNRIVQNFVANPKKNPLIVVVSTLYGFFSKMYALHYIKNNSDKEILSSLQLRNEWALKEYKAALRFFTLAQCEQIIGVLREYDLRSKGVDNVSVSEGELLKEMVFRILH